MLCNKNIFVSILRYKNILTIQHVDWIDECLPFSLLNQFHAVSRKQQGRQREPGAKTLRSPFSTEFWRRCVLSSAIQHRRHYLRLYTEFREWAVCGVIALRFVSVCVIFDKWRFVLQRQFYYFIWKNHFFIFGKVSFVLIVLGFYRVFKTVVSFKVVMTETLTHTRICKYFITSEYLK